MTNEDIERKCHQYAREATPAYTNGDFDRYAIAQAYEEGAKWRINSVWHVTFEMPERGRDFLYESARGWFGINNTAKMAREVHTENWDRFVEGFDVIRWGYIDDLLPTENAENFQRNSADFPRKFRKCRKTSSNGKETEE